MELGFDFGRVLSVDSNFSDANGIIIPSINVISYLDGTTMIIPLAAPAWGQFMPIPGYKVLYVRRGLQYPRVIAFFGNNEEFIRKGETGQSPGDVMFQSPVGLCYLRLAADGSVQLLTGDQASSVEMSEDGIKIKTATNLVLSMSDKSVVELAENGRISITKLDDQKKVLATVEIDSKGSISASTEGDLSVKAKNIFLDGKVWYGPGASDPIQRSLFGDVMTAGPIGTWPIDLVTGVPTKGSQTVKSAP